MRGDRVVIFNRQGTKVGKFTNSWEWKAIDSNGLSEDFIKYFQTIDEGKPVGEVKILFTSSGGGVAFVERETKNTLFYAQVPNAHSAAYLPNGRIAVAFSTAENKQCLAV